MDSINTQLNCNTMSNKTAMTLKERQQALRERRQKLGLVRVEVWVPQHSADEVRKLARQLCKNQS